MDRRIIKEMSPDSHGDLVERLLKATYHGPEVPAEGLLALKAAIRPEWERLVKARRRRRQLALCAGLAAAAVLVIAVIAGREENTGPTQVAVATIQQAIGTTELRQRNGTAVVVSAGNIGQSIEVGTVVCTGAEARMAFQLNQGHSVRVDQSTVVRLIGPDVLDLLNGGVYVDSGRAGAPGLKVRSQFGTASDIGTQFEVRSEKGLIVRVREGTVRFSRNGDSMEVPAGFQARVTPGGNVVTGAIRPYDPSWDWAQKVATPFAIDGQTVAAFLDWVSRETGLRVRFECPRVEHLAETTILYGTIDGLEPVKASTLILPGCGLEAKKDGPFLVVDLLGTGR